MKQLNIVNFLKGFSIFTIVLMHLIQSYDTPTIIKTATSFGGAGVHVFFLCSGFGLYLSFLNKPLTYLEFIKKRFFRVYIPYIIIICISFLSNLYSYSDNFITLMSHIFLFKMFIETYEGTFGYQMWFISTIFQFYLCWPLIVHFYNKSKNKVVLWALAISLLWGITTILLKVNDQRIFNSFFLQYLWEFVLGMKIADIYKEKGNIPNPSTKLLIFISVLGISLTGILGVMGGLYKSFNDIPSLMGYASLALLLYKFLPKRCINIFLFTNKISYDWYLTHILIFTAIFKYCSAWNVWISGFFALILSYLFAYIFHKIISLLKI